MSITAFNFGSRFVETLNISCWERRHDGDIEERVLKASVV